MSRLEYTSSTDVWHWLCLSYLLKVCDYLVELLYSALEREAAVKLDCTTKSQDWIKGE